MKTKSILLKLILILACVFATTAVFGQDNIWTNSSVVGPNGNNIGVHTNYTGPYVSGGLGSGDTLEWNETVTGPMVVYQNDGIDHNTGNLVGGSSGANGVSFYINAAQTDPVQISTTASPASVNMGFNTFTVDPGAGQFILGDNTSGKILATVGRPSGATHDFQNQSANAVIICPNVEWQNGGGSAMTLAFDDSTGSPGSGFGNYSITNNLNSGNSGTVSLQFLSSGIILWNGPSLPGIVNGTIASPVLLEFGTTLDLQTNNLLTTQAIQNNNTGGFGPCPLIYDGHSAQTLSGIIGGSSPSIAVIVNSGTLTLSGANIFTGDVTNLGGELIAGRAEAGTSGPLGEGNIIHFFGGTLGWSLANTFDYSSRFDTAPGQAYNLDSGVANVTLATGLGSSGGTLTKFGNGTLTLASANSYGGATTVSAGELLFQGAMTGTGGITVNNGTTLGAYANGTQIQPSTLALGTTAGVTLEFNSVSSTSSAIIAAGALSAQSTNLVTINIKSGTFSVGHSYPLFTWGGVAPAPATQLGILNGYIGNVSTNGNQIQLNITGTAYTWTGLNNNSWDLATANNWQQNGGPVIFANGFPTLFDDSASGNFNLTNSGVVAPLALTFNNTTNAYQITSSPGNDIGGNTGLSKQGTNTLSLNGGANAYTGITTLSAGTVTVSALANGGSASDIGAANNNATNLVLTGGTLQYTNGTVQIDRSFTVTTAGGTIDASGVGALQFTNTGAIAAPGSGTRTLILTGSAATNNAMGLVIADSTGGATSLQKGVPGGPGGEWDLTGPNTYSGTTTIDSGLLSVGNGGSTGSLGTGGTVDNGVLYFNRTNSSTYGGAISGTGPVTLLNGTLTLTGNNSYSGGTSISNGATLNVGSGGSGANLRLTGAILNNGNLVFNSSSAITIRGFPGTISGSGNIEDKGTGLINAVGYNNTYTGWVQIDAGATFQICIGNEGQFLASALTNNGTLLVQRQDQGVFIITNNVVGTGKLVSDANNQNSGNVSLFGTNTYTGGTIIADNGLVLGDGVTPGAGSIVGNVNFTNSATGQNNYRQLEFNRPDSFTFSGNITGTNNGALPNGAAFGTRGTVLQNGTGVLTLTGNNTWLDGTIISNGVLQVGNGGASGTLGATNGQIEVLTMLVYDTSSSQAASGPIWPSGTVVQSGSGTLTLSGAITLIDTNLNITGSLTASNGTLVVATGGAEVDANINVNGGTLAAAVPGTVGTLTVTNASMTISSGAVLVSLNKSLAQSNSVFVVTNVVATGGSLILTNASGAPALAVGDTFTIFSQAVTGGNNITVVPPQNVTVTNNLAVNGSVTVLSAGPGTFSNKTGITGFSLNGANVTITATNGQSGDAYYLLESTNVGLPLGQWLPVATNILGANGNYTFIGTNVVTPNGQHQFYILSNTNN